MEQFLTKLNIVNKSNYINKLEKENKSHKENLNKYTSNFKKVITEMEIERRKNLETIKKLEGDNKKLKEENNNYKNILNKIPRWIIRICVRRERNIGGYLDE